MSQIGKSLHLAWAVWGANRRGFTNVLIVLVLCAVVYRLIPAVWFEPPLIRLIWFIPFALSLILVFSFISATVDSDEPTVLSAFPQRVFVLPINTLTLVSVHLLLAVLSVTAVYFAWGLLVLEPAGLPFAAWPLSFVLSGVICFQALIWCLSRHRLTRLIIMGTLGTVLMGLAVVLQVESAGIAGPVMGTTTFGILLGLNATACLAAGWGVRHQRRGDYWTFFGSVGLTRSLQRSSVRRRPPFSSPATAQFWYEWRRNGIVLPFAVGFATMLIITVGSVMVADEPAHILLTLAWLFASPMILAVFVGQGFAKVDFWRGDTSLPVFLAIRPVSCGTIVLTKMRVAVMATVISWTLVLGMSGIWLAFLADTSALPAWQEVLYRMYPSTSLWALLALCIGAGMLITWRYMVLPLPLGLSRRSRLYYFGILINILVVVGIVVFIAIVASRPTVVAELLRQFGWIPWVLNLLILAKVWLAVAAWRKSLALGLVDARHVVTCLATWVLGTGYIVLLFWFLW